MLIVSQKHNIPYVKGVVILFSPIATLLVSFEGYILMIFITFTNVSHPATLATFGKYIKNFVTNVWLFERKKTP